MGGSLIFGFVGNVLPSNCDFLLKIKMVRMVHRKGFYSTELEICDEKSELWRKSKILGRSKNGKIRFEVQNLSFEGVFKDKMIFKNILTPSAIILA